MPHYRWLYDPLADAWELAHGTVTYGMGPGQQPWTVQTFLGAFDVACCCCRTMTVSAYFERVLREHVATVYAEHGGGQEGRDGLFLQRHRGPDV